jgi:hypothetical protein
LSWDVPNYFTFAAEIAVAIFIALYFHKVQSKSNKKIESYTEDIRDTLNRSIKLYINEQKSLFETRKKYYLNKIKESLVYIKKKDKYELKTMCANAEAYLEFLVPYLNNLK